MLQSKTEKIALWVIVGLLFIWLLALTIIVAGEFKSINRLLSEEKAALTSPPDAGQPVSSNAGKPDVEVAGAEVVSGTVAVTVTVRHSGASDLLYEPPKLTNGSGKTYPITGESMEEARYAFLDLVTKGQVMTQMKFTGSPSSDENLTLTFNPEQEANEEYVAPRVRTKVQIGSGK